MSSREARSDSTDLTYQFGEFKLDVANRQLCRLGKPVELKSRYFDALVLLVKEQGQLIEKERFFTEIWTDSVVSDHALTQCIKDIRKALDDDATNPTFVQTVPRHGYRFVGNVRTAPAIGAGSTESGPTVEETVSTRTTQRAGLQSAFREWLAATIGGATAGLLGGMFYGFGLASPESGVGTLSTLLVLISLNVIVGLTGGLGVGLGLAVGGIAGRVWGQTVSLFRIIGSAIGGMLVGGLVRLLGVDAFNLLLGSAPEGITGGREGAALGFLITLGAYGGWKAAQRTNRHTGWGQTLGGGLGGLVAGAFIPLTGGSLMGGSLHVLADQFAQSRLNMDAFSELLGSLEFGPATEAALASIEGCLFGLGIFGALSIMSRWSQAELFRQSRQEN